MGLSTHDPHKTGELTALVCPHHVLLCARILQVLDLHRRTEEVNDPAIARIHYSAVPLS